MIVPLTTAPTLVPGAKQVEWNLRAIREDVGSSDHGLDNDEIIESIVNPSAISAPAYDAESIMHYRIPARWAKNSLRSFEGIKQP